jgi:sensor domain CHASE-containing protein
LQSVIRHLLQLWFAFEMARSYKMMHLALVVPLVEQGLAFLAKIPRMHPRIYLGFIVAVIKQFLVLKRKLKLKSYLMLQIDH